MKSPQFDEVLDKSVIFFFKKVLIKSLYVHFPTQYNKNAQFSEIGFTETGEQQVTTCMWYIFTTSSLWNFSGSPYNQSFDPGNVLKSPYFGSFWMCNNHVSMMKCVSKSIDENKYISSTWFQSSNDLLPCCWNVICDMVFLSKSLLTKLNGPGLSVAVAMAYWMKAIYQQFIVGKCLSH